MALRCDLIIRNAVVFDGTATPRFTGDVGVAGDRIVAVGDLGGATADAAIDAGGKAIAPGFIDAHTHDDRAVLCGPECMLCKMSQGVSTVVVGNCSISLSPVRMTYRPVPPLRASAAVDPLTAPHCAPVTPPTPPYGGLQARRRKPSAFLPVEGRTHVRGGGGSHPRY
jgi:N-acyl-D-aspartate/D-glutamate deacylase